MDDNYVEDDEESVYEGLYEDGHWEWDSRDDQLVFISDIAVKEHDDTPININFGSIEFREDIDLIEQQRFRKRVQRKTDQDVVTLQDVKDLVLFTAPRLLLKPILVNILHLPTTERFLRALILYCQYYLQIANEMTIRKKEGVTKIRTTESNKIEAVYRENLQDLRLLVFKEYCLMIMGDGDFAKYHHMGLPKRSRSLLKRESVMFESLLRISIQIVWIALGRKSFNQIEVEVNRIFKSDEYNMVSHKLKQHITQTPLELSVLHGSCLQPRHKLNIKSPILDEAYCMTRRVDYSIYGVGVVKYPRLSTRLQFFEHALIEPEWRFKNLGLSLGILGSLRDNFDIMLKQVKFTSAAPDSGIGMSQNSMPRRLRSKSSQGGLRKSAIPAALYPNISIPPRDSIDLSFTDFPTECVPRKPCDQVQRKMWLRRIAHKTGRKTRSKCRVD